MSLQPQGRRVPAQGTFTNGAAAFSRVSGHAWLRLCEKLHYSTGGLIRSWSAVSPGTHDEPIRAELFGIERLEQYAESLAAAQHTTSKPTTIGHWRCVFETMIGHCAPHFTPPSRRSVRPARSRPQPSVPPIENCRAAKSKFGQSGLIFHRASIANCPN
jgi:hypothetical protein